MNAPTSLEERIRRGLQEAAAAIPPTEAQAPPRPRPRRHLVAKRPWTYRLAAGAAVAAAAVAAVVAVTGGDDGPSPSRDVEMGTPEQATTSTLPPIQHPVPGQAVVVGTELRTYDPAGAQTGAISLEPMTEVQAVSSDLMGGWVVCGTNGRVPPLPPGEGSWEDGTIAQQPGETTTVPADQTTVPAADAEAAEAAVPADIEARLEELNASPEGGSLPPASETSPVMWFPAGREPVGIDAPGAFCMANSVIVVEGPAGPTLVYQSMPIDGPMGFSIGAVVLSTGEHREVPLPADVDPGGFYSGTASGNLVALHSDETGLVVFDWTTGAVRPTPAIELSGPGHVSDIALSRDGSSVAAITGDVSGPSDVVVYDLATGAERFRETFPTLATEGAELSYDGRVVAVGNFYAEGDFPYPPITVINFEGGTRHTVDAHGLLP